MSFDDFRTIFFVVIAAFIVFVLVNMLLMKWRWAEEERTRQARLEAARREGAKKREAARSGPASTSTDEALHGTFGTSGIGASDVAVAGMYGTPGAALADVSGSDSSDCGDTGGDYGSDCGGGDSGGGWND